MFWILYYHHHAFSLYFLKKHVLKLLQGHNSVKSSQTWQPCQMVKVFKSCRDFVSSIMVLMYYNISKLFVQKIFVSCGHYKTWNREYRRNTWCRCTLYVMSEVFNIRWQKVNVGSLINCTCWLYLSVGSGQCQDRSVMISKVEDYTSGTWCCVLW
jgi:hypothetical protein